MNRSPPTEVSPLRPSTSVSKAFLTKLRFPPTEVSPLRPSTFVSESLRVMARGLKEGSGVAANVLENLDVNLKRLRKEVERIVKPGPDVKPMSQLPFTPRAEKVLEFAMEEAQQLDHNYVGTEHVLLSAP